MKFLKNTFRPKRFGYIRYNKMTRHKIQKGLKRKNYRIQDDYKLYILVLKMYFIVPRMCNTFKRYFLNIVSICSFTCMRVVIIDTSF